MKLILSIVTEVKILKLFIKRTSKIHKSFSRNSQNKMKYKEEFKSKDKSDNLNEHLNTCLEETQLDINKELKLLTNDDSNPLLSKSIEEVLQSSALNYAINADPNYEVSRRRLYHLR